MLLFFCHSLTLNFKTISFVNCIFSDEVDILMEELPLEIDDSIQEDNNSSVNSLFLIYISTCNY